MIPPIEHQPIDLVTARASLRALYADLDGDVASAGPVCQLSGRCCRFTEYGHTLFLSAPEFALLLADSPAPRRPIDETSCPWQDERGHCVARDARPIGCRVYYCEPAYQTTAALLSERYIERLKMLVADLSLPWNYAPLHHHLAAAHLQIANPPRHERKGDD